MLWRKARHIAAAALSSLVVASPGAAFQATEPALLWEIGGPNAPAFGVWIDITSAELFGDQVVVADPRLPAVRAFSLDGTYRRDLGREGEGPGEFAIPLSVAAWGDTLAVYDLGQRRWGLFDTTGTHLTTTGQRHPEGVPLQWARPLRGGRMVGLTAWRNAEGIEYPISLITWSEPFRIDTLRTFSTGNVRIRIGDSPRLHSSTTTVGTGGKLPFSATRSSWYSMASLRR